MKVFLVVLVLFLLAFTGLAAGLLLKRKGLRGGCRPAPGGGDACHCKSAKRGTKDDSSIGTKDVPAN